MLLQSPILLHLYPNLLEIEWHEGYCTLSLPYLGYFPLYIMQLLEKYSEEVEVLKEEVKDMLVLDHQVGAEKMVLIDALERLGVSYLFQKEIEELLENMFPKFEEYSRVFHDNLFMVSLHFRVFRQHGYDLSSGN
ncbi:hypothetical protein RHMOL_Rhmol12G0141000 [Rhododendron molle]|uniref:Uncharacterized protein n=1 Tax=Rhododendron molle TaxID=49168 RepID=A0ACC0LJJ5_RHOML|nr:hypothetical protein RHMOL_Rhmol12G0141000 [Rhododendron molle]